MRTILVSVALVLGAGCASMEDVRNDRSGGTTGVYAGPVKEVLRAASIVLKREGVEAVEQEPGALFGTIPESFLGDVSSTYCGVWVEAAEDGKVEVRIVTRRRRSLSLLTGLTERTFHEELQRELGRPSPVSEGGLTGR